mgnify:FL=1
MSFGSQLKQIRKFRNLDQAELGESIGLSKRSAYSTISQYERGAKKPRSKETIYKLAETLEVCPFMLEEPDVEHGEKVIHVLFWLAMHYGLEIDELDGQPIFWFNQNKFGVVKNDVLLDQLQDWLKFSKGEKSGLFETARLYDWMLSYPINDDSFISDELDFDSMENFEEAYKKALHKKYVSEVKVEDND